MSQPLRYVVLSTLRPGVIDTVRSAAVGSMEMVMHRREPGVSEAVGVVKRIEWCDAPAVMKRRR